MECRLRGVMLAVLAGGTLAGCGGGASPYDDPSQRESVLAVLEAYYEDFNGRRWDGLATHFWPDAEIMTVWQRPGDVEDRMVATSVAQFVGEAPRQRGNRGRFEMRMLEAEIRIFGNVAAAWVPYVAGLERDAAREEWRGVDAFTLLRHDGEWKIAALVFTSVDS